MDMFMDKLAQKLNAQEIIRANTAADTEELNRLKNQVAEYNECLAKLQKLIEDGASGLQNAQAGSEDIKRLVEESIGKIQAVQQDNAGLENLGKKQDELSRSLEELSQKQEEFNRKQEELQKSLAEAGKSSGELAQGFENLEKAVEERLGTAAAAADENVHKECVKVYRNVQAVVVEESEKQLKAAEGIAETAKASGGKVSAILGISVAALVFSLASVVLQILNMLNITF